MEGPDRSEANGKRPPDPNGSAESPADGTGEETGEVREETSDPEELKARLQIKNNHIRELFEQITASRLAADEARASKEASDGHIAALERDRARLKERIRALEEEVDQLKAAMASRATIEQAKGILMLLTSCGEQVAFDLLAHISSNSHRKVRDVAVAIVESAAGHAGLPEDIQALIRDVCPPSPHR